MPLTSEEQEEARALFKSICTSKKGVLDEKQIMIFIDSINTSMSSQLKIIMKDGISCGGQNRVTESTMQNFYSIVKDNDKLGLLKIGFRAYDTNFDSLISSEDAKELLMQLGIETEHDFNTTILKTNEIKFSQLANAFHIEIPEDADPYSGTSIKSSCCYLI